MEEEKGKNSKREEDNFKPLQTVTFKN